MRAKRSSIEIPPHTAKPSYLLQGYKYDRHNRITVSPKGDAVNLDRCYPPPVLPSCYVDRIRSSISGEEVQSQCTVNALEHTPAGQLCSSSSLSFSSCWFPTLGRPLRIERKATRLCGLWNVDKPMDVGK